MKKQIILIIVILMTLAISGHAAIKTVSNNAGSPGQYTNLQTAIDAAGFNDTILVAGSATSYGNITFGKPLVLIGAGYNNPYGLNSTIGSLTLTRQTYYVSASGTKIMGFIASSLIYNGVYSGGSTGTMSINNVVIERCRLQGSIYLGYGGCVVENFNNDTVRNCLIENTILYGDPCSDHSSVKVYTNVVFHNNIFNGSTFQMGYYVNSSTTYMADLKNFYLRNNVFVNETGNIFYYVKNMVIENNIFYGAEPQGGIGCVFSKNLTYMCVNNTIPGTGNLGSGNKVNQNPLFVNEPPQGGFSFSYDYHLQASSPGKNAGTDGTDIGIYGGMMPFEVGANPYIPQMMETTLPSGSSVPAGGTLNVHFKARKQN